MRKKSRGLWADFMTGIFIIAAVTISYIILQQAYEYNIKPDSLTRGADPTNMGYIEIAWDFWPVPVLIGFLFMILKSGRDNITRGVDINEF